MSIDGLVTFVGLVVALFALATDARRKALMLRRGVTLSLTILFGAAVLYLQLFSVWAPECSWRVKVCRVLILDGENPWITAQQLAFVLVLIWLALVCINLQWKTLGARHLPRLLALATALAEEKRLEELNRVTHPHLNLIAGVAAGHVAASDSQKQAATALLRLLYHRREFIRFIAMERPETAVEMMAVESHIVFEFSDQILRVLVENGDSPLFTEVYDNQNVSFITGYAFPKHNTYLNFLFADARQAERLGAWQPVMEATLAHLAEAKGSVYQAYLSGSADRFQNEERWRDRTFVAIRFMDLMVDAALRQGIQWHMWLYYTTHLTTSLLELYVDPRKDEDVSDEWPTRNAYLIYSIFAALTGWIEAIEHLPADSPHLVLESNTPNSENGNIPKSAIIALGDCLRQVLISEAVSDRFKRYLAEMVFRCIRNLPSEGEKRGFRTTLVASVLAGGVMTHSDHLRQIRSILDREDHLLREQLEDFRKALDDAMVSSQK